MVERISDVWDKVRIPARELLAKLAERLEKDIPGLTTNLPEEEMPSELALLGALRMKVRLRRRPVGTVSVELERHPDRDVDWVIFRWNHREGIPLFYDQGSLVRGVNALVLDVEDWMDPDILRTIVFDVARQLKTKPSPKDWMPEAPQ